MSAAGGQEPPVRAERDTLLFVHGGLSQDENVVSTFDIPKAHCLIMRGGGDAGAVGAERHAGGLKQEKRSVSCRLRTRSLRSYGDATLSRDDPRSHRHR